MRWIVVLISVVGGCVTVSVAIVVGDASKVVVDVSCSVPLPILPMRFKDRNIQKIQSPSGVVSRVVKWTVTSVSVVSRCVIVSAAVVI